MEQDVDHGFRTVCSGCLSSDRDLISINSSDQACQIFRLIMFDFTGDQFGERLCVSESVQLVCWECFALLKKFAKFKTQVHSAQEHLRVLALSDTHETMDHTYMSQSLSSLECVSKVDYDNIFVDCMELPTSGDWTQPFITITQPQDVKHEGFDVGQALRDHISLGIEDHVLQVPEIILSTPLSGVMVVTPESLVTPTETTYTVQPVKGELRELTLESIAQIQLENVPKAAATGTHPKPNYVTEYMTETDMLAHREEAKKKVQYASAVYKCELCVIGFYTQKQVEDHFVAAHRARPGATACKVCYTYIEDNKITAHVNAHYLRYVCKLCSQSCPSVHLMNIHINAHMIRPTPNALIYVAPEKPKKSKKKKDKQKQENEPHPKPGDLRKLLSKTTIVGYKCLECDMFFKNSRARKTHVARYHREGLQCDHCKKRFVNRTTLVTHLKLHQGPLPREECPVCHKMVRVIQLKYHIERHQNKTRYECRDCNKLFSHLNTYQAHLKFSRAHASDRVFKFPCPMCNKGYATKEAMQDHFNYQHLGKTAHKCPVCNKPISSRANVEKHVMRVHGEKKEKPRNHICQTCGKGFTDKKALNQHEVIHSGDRPLVCDICQQSFKQKASLYTHKKRVHKVFPNKRQVEFMQSESA